MKGFALLCLRCDEASWMMGIEIGSAQLSDGLYAFFDVW